MNKNPLPMALRAIFLGLMVAGCDSITAPASPSAPPAYTSAPAHTTSPSATATTRVPTPTPTPAPTLSLQDYFQEVSRRWRVAYFDNLNNQICAMYGDGSAKTCLDFSRFPDGYASNDFLSWSPDGSQLAFVTECNVHIWLLRGGVSSLRGGLTCGIFGQPEWSPDGKSIAYTTQELERTSRGGQSYYTDVFITSLDGSVHRPIPAEFDGGGGSPVWSPDGRMIAYGWQGEIFMFSLADDTITNLTQHPADDAVPEWSPDGQLIAFLSDRGGESALYSMNSDGSGLRMVADLDYGGHYGISITWLPDSENILFMIQLIDVGSIGQLIDVETGVITPLDFDFDTTYATWFTQSEGASVLPLPTPHCATGRSQLYPGIYAVVTGGADDPPNRIRSSPDTSAEIIDQIYPGDIVLVASGPVCVDGLVFWKVEHKYIPGGEGWTAEGNGVDYFLGPYGPSGQLLGPTLTPQAISQGELIIAGALDDHYEIASEAYHLTVKLNGEEIFSGVPDLEHGRPFGEVFSNFADLVIPFEINLLRDGTNLLELRLEGVGAAHWVCWDYILVSDGYEQETIESQSEWGYSSTGVEVIYGGEAQTIVFEH